MLKRRFVLVAMACLLALASAVGLSQAGVGASTAHPGYHSHSSLKWGKCPADTFPTNPLQFCTTVQVPLNYAHPHSHMLTIWVSRIQSAKPGEHIGDLFLSSGGPGFPFTGMPAYFYPLLPKAVLDHFDIYTFDPRFSGDDVPSLNCGLKISNPSQGLPMPVPGGVAANAKIAKNTAESCMKAFGWALPYITNENDARDMNTIRQALGDPALSFLGYGVGGANLGSDYATLFPSYTQRIILDAAVDPNRQGHYFFSTWDETVQTRFQDFALWAAGQNNVYHLGSTPQQVTASYFRLRAYLDHYPIKLAPGARGLYKPILTADAVTDILFTAIAFSQRFPALAEVYHAAFLRDVPLLNKLVPTFVDALMVTENTFESAIARDCTMPGWPRNISVYERAVAQSRKLYPIFEGTGSNVWPCAYWPAPAAPPVKIGGPGPDNILIDQATRDPYAVYSGGPAMEKAFGKRASLITLDAGGHGSFVLADNSCVNDAVTGFMLSGKLPATGLICPDSATWPPSSSGALTSP